MKSLLLALCLVFSGSVNTQAFQTAATEAEAPDYVIGVEDILSVNVWKEPDLSVKEVVVRPDGKISLPLMGDVQANGLTPKQLQERITARIKEYVAAPNVTVVVLKIGSRFVSIVGMVAKPGPYYMGSPVTVLELLAKAGGFREDAKTKKIVIVRKNGDKTQHFRFNYKEVADGRNLQQNITLKSGDMIIVP